MTVYIDPMVDYGRRIGRAGPRWCHMIADNLDELHAIANEIRLRRRWFQGSASVPHYDLGTDGMRERAIAAGAVECVRRAFVDHLRRIKEKR